MTPERVSGSEAFRRQLSANVKGLLTLPLTAINFQIYFLQIQRSDRGGSGTHESHFAENVLLFYRKTKRSRASRKSPVPNTTDIDKLNLYLI